MKINPLDILTNLKGQSLINEDGKPVTLREAIFIALNGISNTEIMPAEMKARIFQIQLKVYSGRKEVILTADQVQLIKERAGATLTPLIYGRLCQAVDPDSFPEETVDEDAEKAELEMLMPGSTPDSGNSES